MNTLFQIGRSPAQPDKVTVTGAHEKVEECIDYLLNLEEEILQELAEREDDDRYIPPSNKFNKEKNKKPNKNVSFVLYDSYSMSHII